MYIVFFNDGPLFWISIFIIVAVITTLTIIFRILKIARTNPAEVIKTNKKIYLPKDYDHTYNPKIITRSWWRNKVFFFISIVSLAIGLACTNLLFTYYVHDYNIESGNRDKNRIFCLRQDNPMQDGSKVAYADANIPPMLKEKYAEVEDYLRINSLVPQYCKYGGEIYHDITFISADTTLQHFFHYHPIAGSLKQVLEQPGKVALSEAFAHKLFGDKIH